jgi:hypothetical protein
MVENPGTVESGVFGEPDPVAKFGPGELML